MREALVIPSDIRSARLMGSGPFLLRSMDRTGAATTLLLWQIRGERELVTAADRDGDRPLLSLVDEASQGRVPPSPPRPGRPPCPDPIVRLEEERRVEQLRERLRTLSRVLRPEEYEGLKARLEPNLQPMQRILAVGQAMERLAVREEREATQRGFEAEFLPPRATELRAIMLFSRDGRLLAASGEAKGFDVRTVSALAARAEPGSTWSRAPAQERADRAPGLHGLPRTAAEPSRPVSTSREPVGSRRVSARGAPAPCDGEHLTYSDRTRVISKPFSAWSSRWYPLSCFARRIFTHRTRSCTSLTPASKCLRSRTPSARKSSANSPNSSSPCFISLTRNVVASRPLRKPKKWNSSRRGFCICVNEYSDAMESIATRSNLFILTRCSIYFSRISSQFLLISSSLCSRRIFETSRMYSSRSSIPSRPSSVIARFRSSCPSSREMYSALEPFALTLL